MVMNKECAFIPNSIIQMEMMSNDMPGSQFLAWLSALNLKYRLAPWVVGGYLAASGGRICWRKLSQLAQDSVMTSYCHMQQRELQKSVWQVHWLLLPTWSESVLVTRRVLCLLGLSIHPEVTDIASVVIYVLSLMCRQCPMVIWIVTLLDRYFFVRFLSVDDPPADMLENTPRVELAMTPSTMYSPLMPLSRCFLHLIYLPIYVFFSYIYVNTCSRSRTSLHVAVLFLAIPTARRSLYVIKAL
jgi:hypothetical protein